jgi:hypothetical protein
MLERHQPVPPTDQARLARYAEMLAFYEGAQWVGRRQRGETRLTFNYARTLVRKVASYVFPGPVTFSVTEKGSEGETPSADAANRAELALNALVAQLDLAAMDVELCIDASVLGDAALKVTWDAALAQAAVAAVDPATLTASPAPDNPRRMRQMTQRYGLTGEGIAELFGALPTGIGLRSEQVYPVIEEWTASRWRVHAAGQVIRDEVNPYGWIPYVVLPNNPRPHAFWGESDLIDVLAVCRELNGRMSVLAKVLELSGAPIAVLENVDSAEGIAVGPGATWELPEGAKAYLLDLLSGGGAGLHIDYVNLLFRALHDLSETPRTAFGDSGRDLSGAALEVEIQPLVQKVARKRRGWDAFFRQRNSRLLDLLERFGGVECAGLRQTTTIWPDVLPSDTDSAVQNEVRLVASGIHSRRTAIASLGGNDPEGELSRVLAERNDFEAPVLSPISPHQETLP